MISVGSVWLCPAWVQCWWVQCTWVLCTWVYHHGSGVHGSSMTALVKSIGHNVHSVAISLAMHYTDSISNLSIVQPSQKPKVEVQSRTPQSI